jgi:hypothetical protein
MQVKLRVCLEAYKAKNIEAFLFIISKIIFAKFKSSKNFHQTKLRKQIHFADNSRQTKNNGFA